MNKSSDEVDIAIELLLYTVKKQIFIDGNKRTSVIFANHYLISKGKGIIVIPVEKINEYRNLLIDYYKKEESSEITKFLKNECYININK